MIAFSLFGLRFPLKSDYSASGRIVDVSRLRQVNTSLGFEGGTHDICVALSWDTNKLIGYHKSFLSPKAGC